MSKYSTLRETPPKEITGARYVKTLSTFLTRKEKLTILRGLPSCPECDYTLYIQQGKNCWICKHCGTVWTTADLVQAIENEAKLRLVSIRQLVD